MEFRPILSSLRRSPTGAILVALQIALALAITVNCLYIVQQRIEKVGKDPGIDIANLFIVTFAPIRRDFHGAVVMREDVQLLRGLPGVVDATTINAALTTATANPSRNRRISKKIPTARPRWR